MFQLQINRTPPINVPAMIVWLLFQLWHVTDAFVLSSKTEGYSSAVFLFFLFLFIDSLVGELEN